MSVSAMAWPLYQGGRRIVLISGTSCTSPPTAASPGDCVGTSPHACCRIRLEVSVFRELWCSASKETCLQGLGGCLERQCQTKRVERTKTGNDSSCVRLVHKAACKGRTVTACRRAGHAWMLMQQCVRLTPCFATSLMREYGTSLQA